MKPHIFWRWLIFCLIAFWGLVGCATMQLANYLLVVASVASTQAVYIQTKQIKEMKNEPAVPADSPASR